VELLTVVGILVILATIAVIAFRFVGDRTKVNSARVTLETLKGLTQEAETAGAFGRPVSGWFYENPAGLVVWQDGSLTTTPVSSFWKRPTAVAAAIFAPTGRLDQDILVSIPPSPPVFPVRPATILSDWSDNAAIKNTAIATLLLRNVPGPRKTLDGLPLTTVRLPSVWDDNQPYSPSALVLFSASTTGSNFSNGLSVFRARQSLTAATPAPTAQGDTVHWERSFAGPLDTFGRPILFVPACGMQVGGAFESAKSYDVANRVFTGTGSARVYYECIAPAAAGTAVTNTALWRLATPIRSPDGKPFWASAGPDGTFDTAGDNLYSFEN